jgi:predicted metal-dependent HD superfamily phosphohydrolase
VLFSIFFHDIIYDPKENDNEERSALLWLEFAEDVQDVSA